MKKYDYLPNTDIYLYQDDRFLKLNTDTVLLGQFYKLKDNENILDIGTNNGALLLFKKDVKADFYAIEIIEDALKIAEANFKYNNMLVHCIHLDVKEYKENTFDVIVCNPPYFNDTNYNINDQLNIQRHDISLGLDELVEAVEGLLKPNGRFYLVHRANYLNDIYTSLLKHSMRPRVIKLIYDENKDTARSVLLEIIKSNNVSIDIVEPHYVKR